eukprot:m.51413 g.51413  ORF g.51413 m.51413 type:complete len:404 (-) comp10733_c0_seq2:19-1230(-)
MDSYFYVWVFSFALFISSHLPERVVSTAPVTQPMQLFSGNLPTPAGIAAGCDEPSLLYIPPSTDNVNGTLLAVCGAIPAKSGLGRAIVLRRSIDLGVSWSNITFPLLPFSNPVNVGTFFQSMLTYDPRAGLAILTVGNITDHVNSCGNGGSTEDENGILQVTSADRGLSWTSPPLNVNKYLPGAPCMAPTTGHGVFMGNSNTPAHLKGRVLMVGVNNAYHGDVIIYSDDDGKTYNFSTALHEQGYDEGSIAQLPNGSLAIIMRNCMPGTPNCQMMQSRNKVSGGGGKRFMWSVSDDGGVSWTKPYLHPDLVTPVCQGSLTGYKDALYFVGPYSEVSRSNLTVLGSDDNGASFKRSLNLWPSAAGYTGFQCGLPGDYDCAVLFDGYHGTCSGICFLKFSSSAVV